MPTAPPPYLRLAGELRRRITSGELRPGQRLPSLRSLARRWKVALATATRAVGILAQEGLIETRPRTGAVVATPRPVLITGGTGGELSRERIVAAAIAIADEEGFPALSIRGVAARLGTPVMSLYRHVRHKEDLIQHMVDAVLGESTFPARPPPGWRAQVELAARMQWRIFQRHPWLTRVMTLTRPRPQPNALLHAEWSLRALAELGLDAPTMMRVHILLFGFIQGLAVNLDVEAQEAGDTGVTQDDWMTSREADFLALARSGTLPTFARVLDQLQGGFELDLETIFELGLRALLDGLATRLPIKRSSRSRAS